MKGEELKPCPFCGNTDINKIDIIEGVEMVCICNAFIELSLEDRRVEAIMKWNKQTKGDRNV